MRKTIGIDFGATNLKGAVVNEDSKMLLRHKGMKTRPKRKGTEIAKDIVKIAEELLAKHPDVMGAGIGSPGIVYPSGKYGFPPVNCPNFGNVNLKAMVEEATGKPCFISNDAQVFGAGERRWGAGKGAKCMLMLTLGTGIGGGLSYRGQDFIGARNTTEIGHTCIDFTPNAEPCGCGNTGCAEAYASDRGISRQAEAAISKRLLPKPRGGVEAKWLYELAQTGNPLASGIVDKAHEALATLISNFANTMSIDVCVLAGGITAVGDYLFDDVRSRVRARLLPTAKVDIRPAALGKDFGSLGAAAYAFDMLGA